MPLGGALGGLIHPLMLEALERSFYPALVTIEANTPSNSGGVLTDAWTAVSTALTGLACTVAAVPTDERRRSEPYLRTARETHHVSIAGSYPAITAEMRAVVTRPSVAAGADAGEALTLNILAVEHDSQNFTTRLRAEEVTH